MSAQLNFVRQRAWDDPLQCEASSMTDLNVPQGNAKPPRVGLFVTCLADLQRPNLGFAAIKLLEAAGCTVEVPLDQTCCGQPAFNWGATKRLRGAFSGNVRGMGPGAAEMEFVERGAEPVVFFMADKTEPSAYSMPLTRTFMDPFTTTGLIIDPKAHEGFKFEIQDVLASKKCMMSAPEESYDILSLLGDTSRYAIKRISARTRTWASRPWSAPRS